MFGSREVGSHRLGTGKPRCHAWQTAEAGSWGKLEVKSSIQVGLHRVLLVRPALFEQRASARTDPAPVAHEELVEGEGHFGQAPFPSLGSSDLRRGSKRHSRMKSSWCAPRGGWALQVLGTRPFLAPFRSCRWLRSTRRPAGNLATAEQSATPDTRDILWHSESRLRSILPSSEGHTCPSLLWIAVTSHLLAPPACRSCAVVAAARGSLCLPIERRPIHTRRSIMFL